MKIAFAALVGACIVAPAFGQQTPAAIIVSPATQSSQPLLRQGTAVSFKTEQALSSKSSNAGDRFELRSTEDVRVASHIVIPAGSRGVGEVTNVVRKGAFGKSGKLDTRVLYVMIGDNRISMAGKSHDQGEGGTVGVVAAAVLLWPVMPFVTGQSAVFPVGTSMTGYVENDVPIAFAPETAPAAVPIRIASPPAAVPDVVKVSAPAH